MRKNIEFPTNGRACCKQLRSASGTLAFVALLAFAGCTPPTEVIDLRTAPQATKDAMLRVNVLPLGMPAPPGAGSIGPISGFACSPSAEAASLDAVQQLRIKALSLHATAVVDVLVGPGGAGTCLGGFTVVANGIAVGPRGIPSSY